MSEQPDFLSSGALRVIEYALNRLLQFDPASTERLQPLAGRSLRVALRDTPVTVLCRFDAEGLRLERDAGDEASETADASVDTSLAGLVSLAGSGGKRSQDVAFQGDVGVIQEVKALFGDLEVDWEEQLSRITGDVVAHQAGEAVRQGREWGRRSGDSFLSSLGEFLTEERQLLPTEAELSRFVDDVHHLRTDTDRLEARLRRLEQRNRG